MNCCLCQNQFVPGVQRVGTWRSEENSVIKGEDQGTGNSSSREGMPGNILRHFLLSHSALPSPLHSALLHQYLNTWNRVPQNCCFFFLFASAGHLMIMLLTENLQPERRAVSPRSSLLGTFCKEEGLRLSDRNSILMT